MSHRSGMPFAVEPLGERDCPGVRVTGLAAGQIGDPAIDAALRALWTTHGLVVFRGLTGTETHLALSRVFGTLTSHPSGVSHNREHPELADIGYTPENGNVVQIGGRQVGAYLPWHSDLIYFAEINRGGILRAIDPATVGGLTGFLDKAAAWARLPADLQRQAEGRSAIYWGDFRMESCRYAQGATTVRRSAAGERIVAKRDEFPHVVHPLVCAHPETGQTLLNVSPWFSVGVEGLDEAEGLALLDALVAHATREENAYFHQWERNDMVLWDNWRMLHCCTGVPVETRRIMQRTTIMGDYGLGRTLVAPPGSEKLERISV